MFCVLTKKTNYDIICVKVEGLRVDEQANKQPTNQVNYGKF